MKKKNPTHKEFVKKIKDVHLLNRTRKFQANWRYPQNCKYKTFCNKKYLVPNSSLSTQDVDKVTCKDCLKYIDKFNFVEEIIKNYKNVRFDNKKGDEYSIIVKCKFKNMENVRVFVDYLSDFGVLEVK